VLIRAHERYYHDLVNEVLQRTWLFSPRAAERGTAPGLLYALLRLSEVERDAYVVVLPSDHFVSDDREFMRHVDLAFEASVSRPEMTAPSGDHAARRGVRVRMDRAGRAHCQIRPIVSRAPVLGNPQARSRANYCTSTFSLRANNSVPMPAVGNRTVRAGTTGIASDATGTSSFDGRKALA
jgi:hypothetical protein